MLIIEFATEIGQDADVGFNTGGWAFTVMTDAGEILEEQAGCLPDGKPIPPSVWTWVPLGLALRWIESQLSAGIPLPEFDRVKVVGTSAVIAVLCSDTIAHDKDQQRAEDRINELTGLIRAKRPCKFSFEAGEAPLAKQAAIKARESADASFPS